MKKLFLLVAGLVLIVVPSLAGEYLMNDTGETVCGLRVVFSEPVELTGFGDVLNTVKPTGKATEFIFSGGELDAWAGHWFNWEPASVTMLTYEWYISPMTVEIPEGGLTREDLLNLGRPPTYKEIMSVIAEYPGSDEPLYEPAPDEAFWLTDLEGHADIYDNDSIKINYADWFDQSQVTKIEVYRNGIKMRFLPDTLDVLTNEQMKTFDGNPLEHTPASNHTDHAIMGYEFQIKMYNEDRGLKKTLETNVESSVTFGGEYRFAHVGHNWWQVFPVSGPHPLWNRQHMADEQINSYLDEIVSYGFNGIQIGVYLFMDAPNSNNIFPMYEYDLSRIPEWQQTPEDSAIEILLSLAKSKGLQTELHLELWITEDYERNHPNEAVYRGTIKPVNISSWFKSLTDWAVYYATLAEDLGADYFCPFDELDSMEKYTDCIYDLLRAVDDVFSGDLIIAGSIHHYNLGWFPSGATPGTFWDYPGLIRGENSWNIRLDDNKSQQYSNMTEKYKEFWEQVIIDHTRNYPGHKFFLSAVGFYNWDGQVLGYGSNPLNSSKRDDQEIADSWAAVFNVASQLGIDGVAIWDYNLSYQLIDDGNTVINEPPIIYIIKACIKE